MTYEVGYGYPYPTFCAHPSFFKVITMSILKFIDKIKDNLTDRQLARMC